MTERLWITQPRRTTCLATVTKVQGSRFALDRSLFAPTSRDYRHPQPHDTGMVWIDGGEKRRLVSTFHDRGELWHQLRGTTPPVGATLNCQLDQDRRSLESRAHTAMHLVLASMWRLGGPALASDPTVKGGGRFRLDLAAPYIAPTDLAAWLQASNEAVAANHRVERTFLPRGNEERVLDAQRFDPPQPFPGPPDSLAACSIGNLCRYPCDGTHVEQTLRVGRIQFEVARPGATFTLVARVRDAP